MSSDQLLQQLGDANQTIESLKERVAQMAARIAWLEKSLFGAKSEKNVIPPLPTGPQLDIFGLQGEATPAEIKEESREPKRLRSRGKGRRPLPKDLPREEIVIDLAAEEKTCACCGKARVRIGEDVTEKLEVVPARLYVVKYIRPRYACGGCKDAVAQAPLPAFPIQRAAAGASLLAFLMLGKYADHLPLCRMERLFARHDIDMPRAKTSAWMMQLAELLKPLVTLMQRRIVEKSHVIGADETSIQRLDPGQGKTKTCYLWEYRGDENAPYIIFDFQESRGRAGPKEILGGFTGYLQCDAYAVYTTLREKEGLVYTQVGCWAHARRKFVEALAGGDDRAHGAVELIRELYRIEKTGREKMASGATFDHEALRKLREEESVPALERLRDWMNARLDVVPKSPLGTAIGYALDNWTELTVYTTDGRLPIDNNAVERSIRPVALGRKNWLFAGSDRGGEAAATFFSIIESARRADVNLWHYITDLLKRLPSHPINRLEELLPDHWQPKTS